MRTTKRFLALNLALLLLLTILLPTALAATRNLTMGQTLSCDTVDGDSYSFTPSKNGVYRFVYSKCSSSMTPPHLKLYDDTGKDLGVNFGEYSLLEKNHKYDVRITPGKFINGGPCHVTFDLSAEYREPVSIPYIGQASAREKIFFVPAEKGCYEITLRDLEGYWENTSYQAKVLLNEASITSAKVKDAKTGEVEQTDQGMVRKYTVMLKEDTLYSVQVAAGFLNGFPGYTGNHTHEISIAPVEGWEEEMPLPAPAPSPAPANTQPALQPVATWKIEPTTTFQVPKDSSYYFSVSPYYADTPPHLILYNSDKKGVVVGRSSYDDPSFSCTLTANTNYLLQDDGTGWGGSLAIYYADSEGKILRNPEGSTEPGGTPVSVTERFADVRSDAWYRDAIQYVSDKGMMTGVDSNTFSPETTCTRGTVVTMLYRLDGEPAVAGSRFSDVPQGAWYAKGAAWAAANGIVNGFEDGTFRPESPVTREQLAAILYRYAAKKGYDVTSRAGLTGFSDAGNISTYAVDAMGWAKAAGIITGTDWGGVDPTGTAIRAEIAAMLMRFCENVMK